MKLNLYISAEPGVLNAPIKTPVMVYIHLSVKKATQRPSLYVL